MPIKVKQITTTYIKAFPIPITKIDVNVMKMNNNEMAMRWSTLARSIPGFMLEFSFF